MRNRDHRSQVSSVTTILPRINDFGERTGFPPCSSSLELLNDPRTSSDGKRRRRVCSLAQRPIRYERKAGEIARARRRLFTDRFAIAIARNTGGYIRPYLCRNICGNRPLVRQLSEIWPLCHNQIHTYVCLYRYKQIYTYIYYLHTYFVYIRKRKASNVEVVVVWFSSL